MPQMRLGLVESTQPQECISQAILDRQGRKLLGPVNWLFELEALTQDRFGLGEFPVSDQAEAHDVHRRQGLGVRPSESRRPSSTRCRELWLHRNGPVTVGSGRYIRAPSRKSSCGAVPGDDWVVDGAMSGSALLSGRGERGYDLVRRVPRSPRSPAPARAGALGSATPGRGTGPRSCASPQAVIRLADGHADHSLDLGLAGEL